MKRKQSDNTDKPRPSAYDKALGLLARREQSRRELHRKLDLGGYAKDESDKALARLGEQRYQDDERFAAMLLRNRAGQGYGPARIRMELKTHGLADATIRRLLDEAEVDWQASAANQLRRRYGGKPAADREEQGKRAQFLLRRGFSAATVRYATHADVDEADEED
ncbi:regulatory protein RecX [Rhodanobacter sp. DHG33]|uniref:regulatory protein RecX n=1 Tax=Rhodanobacter sp. DHG33 TaxID=2775921 RepID=UPI00177D83AE|nr:regulatory protein RecX [Rhodanobacter sp. DHG33]MBD8899928.1 regulatory protein RecX [Rhodanobacter sp. DHG33]